MKAILSTNYNDTYLYFLPIVTKLWNLLGVDVICFVPKLTSDYDDNKKIDLLLSTIRENNLKIKLHEFNAPKHKEATYAQCLRNYAACLDLPKDELLVTSDIDMGLFMIPPYNGGFTILGSDLVPKGQFPVCYVTAKVEDWRDAFELNEITYQDAIDRLLGEDECQDYRGCRWSVDQEQLYKKINENASLISLCNRSNGQNQFAQNRIDREDTYWRDRLNNNIIDVHFWRDGFTEENHANAMELLKFVYPHENFDWINQYRKQYISLIKK